MTMFDTFVNLQLPNFSSLFEIAATLNLIFVAAEHAKQYGSTLTKNFFQSQSNISNRFEERFNKIDKESVESMTAIVINGVSTEGEIQQAKRDIHKLEDSKKARINKLVEQTENRCVLTSFSFISLFMFFYSIFALFVGGLSETPFSKSFFTTFTLFSVVVLCLVSCFGEKEKPKWITGNLSLTKCCWCFCVVFLFSSISIYYMDTIEVFSVYYWPMAILVSSLLPFLSFIIFMIIIRKRLIDLLVDLNAEVVKFDTECKIVESHIHQLKEAYELSVNMNSRNTDN